MSAKRKLMVSLFSIVFVVFAVVTTFSVVYGLTQQDIDTMIDMEYVVEDIDGYVEATYTIGNITNNLIPVGTKIENNKLIFEAGDTENAGNFEFPNEILTLNEINDNLIIKYSYSNTGDKHYIASMDFGSTLNKNNMKVEYSINGEDYSEDRYAVVVPANSTNKEYYIKISIDDKSYYANFTAKISWILQGCDPQSVEYLSYENLDIQGSNGAYTATYNGGYIHTGELVYPSEINGSPVTSVASSSTITSEQKSYIKSVTIPDSVTTIEDNAFNGYTHLEEVVFGDVAEVSAQSTATSSLTTVGEFAFANCSRLEGLTLPSSVTSVGKNVFENCYNLKQFIMPNGVTTLTEGMFKNCSSLTSVEINENIVDLPAEIFSGCTELVNFEISECVERIGTNAFKNCKRLSGELDLHYATNIGESAFEGCAGLTKITVGESVTTLGSSTFAGCENVEQYYFLAHNAITTLSDANVLKNIDEDCKIYVIETLLQDYSADEKWATYVDHFDEIGFTKTGECINSLEEPIIDMKIYGNSVQIMLPEEYQQVEYIESTGSQYLVVDYIASGITSAKGKFQITDTSKAAFLFGSRNVGGANTYSFHWGGGTPYKYYNSYSGASITTVQIDNLVHTFYKDKGKLYVDNTIITTKDDTNFTTPSKMNVFACYNENKNGYLPPYARIYYLQFLEEGELKVNLIPCYRKADNEIGMFDLVNNVFYTNAGTGIFAKGNNTNGTPTPDTPVEIKSVGEKSINLLPFDGFSASRTTQGITYTNNNDGTITVSGTADGWVLFDISKYLLKLTPGKKYYFINKGDSTGVDLICAYKDENKAIKYDGNNKAWDSRWSLYLYLQVSPNVTANGTVIPMFVEAENKNKNYEPYGYKIPVKVNGETTNIYLDEPLRKVGDVADYIDLKTGKVVRRVKQGVITHNSSFGKFNGVTNYSAFYMEVYSQISYSQLNKINYPILSNKFAYHAANDGNVNSYWTGAYQISPSLAATYNRIIFSLPNTITSVSEAKSWLADNPVEFSYVLATPTEETIEIPEFSTISGNTTFEVLTSVQPSQIMVKYHK